MTARRITTLILILLAVQLFPMDSHAFGAAAKKNVPRGKKHVKGRQGRSARLEKKAESEYGRYSRTTQLAHYRQMQNARQAGLQQMDHGHHDMQEHLVESNNRNQ